MHDIRLIRENSQAFDAALTRRGVEPQSAARIGRAVALEAALLNDRRDVFAEAHAEVRRLLAPPEGDRPPPQGEVPLNHGDELFGFGHAAFEQRLELRFGGVVLNLYRHVQWLGWGDPDTLGNVVLLVIVGLTTWLRLSMLLRPKGWRIEGGAS